MLDDPRDPALLDLSLPGRDGLSVLVRLREAQCPARVLILTARSEVEPRVKGLHAGADDYLAKPFSMNELIARVEALGRRSATSTPGNLVRVSDLHMDVRHRRVTHAGKAVALSPREFDVLQVLMQEPGRPFSRTELCERVWQCDHEFDTRTVEIFITRLRKKMTRCFPLRSSTRCAASATRSGPRDETARHAPAAAVAGFAAGISVCAACAAEISIQLVARR